MNCQIVKPVQGGSLKAIPSKSAAHRLMIAAGLSGLSLEGKADGLSEDISATKECIQALLGDGEVKMMNCRESGSTLRFMVPVAAVFGGRNEFAACGRLPERPMTALREQLVGHGCTMSRDGENPIWTEGKLEAGIYRLPGNISSQYVTGLLMALPLCEGNSRIEIDGVLQSRPYVDMTLDVLKKAGIEIYEGESFFEVRGKQRYNLPEKYIDDIEGDWSNAAFWLVMDAVSEGNITCTGLNPDSAQGDKRIADYLNITCSDKEIDIDVSDIPDLVPVLCVLASARKKGAVTNIVNAQRLRFKESDRLKAVTEVMNGLGADIEERYDSLAIRGVERLKGGTADGYNDHRIVMMAATAACISDGVIEIKGCEAVNKSYPAFFEHYTALGGEVAYVSSIRKEYQR